MFRRAPILIGLALIVASIAAACGGDSTKDNAPTAAPATPAAAASPAATKASGNVILATTTSTQDSGLLDVLVPMFEKESGYTVKTVAVGTGAAITQGSRGDADVVLVHAASLEVPMIEAGDGIERALVMHNDFIIVGPPSDSAGIKSAATTNDAMTAIATRQAPFISRGDNSGTNVLELKLWKVVNITPKGQSWYSESGQGMGATLQVADQKGAYTISDRGTYLSQKKNLALEIVRQGDPALLNVYHVIVVNPAKHSNVNVVGARAFAAFIVRADIQNVIGEFGKDKFGAALFFPDAGKPDPAP